MAPCLTCTKTKVLPRCSTQLTIGIIPFISTNIYIFIKNITTGYPTRQDAVSTATGLVNIDMTDPSRDFFSQNHTYEVWVTLRDTTVEERLDIALGGETSECFTLEFEPYYSTENTPAVYATYVLQLDENVTLVTPIFDLDTNDDKNYNLDGANVERWVNQGTGNDGNQTVGANQPLFTAVGLNGQSTFTFDNAVPEYFDVLDFSYGRTHFHIMALINASGAGVRSIFGQGDSLAVDYQYLVILGSGQMEYIIANALGSYQIRSVGAVIAGGWHVVEGIFSDSHITLFSDGVPLQLEIGGNAAISEIPEIATGMFIAGRDAGGAMSGFNGDMRCMRIWDSALTATQRQDEVLNMLAKI